MTCDWDEIGRLTGGAQWTVRNVRDRIESRGEAWRDYAKTRQTTVKARKLLGVTTAAT